MSRNPAEHPQTVEGRPGVGKPISAVLDLADDELVVWRYQRGSDDAWLYSEDRYALDYDDDPDEYSSEPEQVIVNRQWYETLPEDPGP